MSTNSSWTQPLQALSAGLGQAAAGHEERVARAVYRSRSLMSESEHAQLLVQCHRKNRRLGLTGLLVIQKEHIVQILEGPKAALDALLDRIQADHRHTEFEWVERIEETGRLFPQWAMGSVALSVRGVDALLEEIASAGDEERQRLARLIREGRPLTDRSS